MKLATPLLPFLLLVPVAAQTTAASTALKEMTPDRLLRTGWENEKLELDFDRAIAAYEELVRRKNADVVLRIKAFQRLYDIWFLTANFEKLGNLTTTLLLDRSLPARYRQPLQTLGQLMVKHGARAQRVFREEHSQFRRKTRKDKRPAHHAERERLRTTFIRQVRKRMQQINQALRIDFATPRAGLRQLQAIARAGRKGNRAQELSRRVHRIRQRMIALEREGKMRSEAYRRLRAEKQREEARLRNLIRRRDSSPSERRRLHTLSTLENEIQRLHKSGKHDRADGKIDEALEVQRALPRALRPRFWTLRSALRSPVVRRPTLTELHALLQRHRPRLAKMRPEAAVTVERYSKQVKPLLDAKNWLDAARVTIAYAERHGWFNRVWRTRRDK